VAIGGVHAGVLPAGRYATVTHVGHPDELARVTTKLLDWAAQQGLRWDMAETSAGQRWRCRLEIYHTDPAEEPDMRRWQTELAFRLAG
jgi:effector-binding domain-containing protein